MVFIKMEPKLAYEITFDYDDYVKKHNPKGKKICNASTRKCECGINDFCFIESIKAKTNTKQVPPKNNNPPKNTQPSNNYIARSRYIKTIPWHIARRYAKYNYLFEDDSDDE
jgi:hypothetical protein